MMSKINVGINGFGRIGRIVVRSLAERVTPINSGWRISWSTTRFSGGLAVR